MKTFIRNHIARIGSAVLVAAFAIAALPAIASAQVAPGEEIQGTIQSINGTWNITVLDANGYLDNVGLHQGTIINPTGLTLAPGMDVTILGYTDGDVFQANEIDTPYQYSGALPVPVYYGPGWWYPGYSYGYGPSFSLVLGFGGGSFFVQRQAWGGHWWASTPVHGWVGFRYPESHGYTAPRYVAPAPAPAYRRPEVRTYAQPQARTYARPAAPAYRGGYSAARPTYNGGARPAYNGGARPAYSGGARPTYNGGARPSNAGHSNGGSRGSRSDDRHH